MLDQSNTRCDWWRQEHEALSTAYFKLAEQVRTLKAQNWKLKERSRNFRNGEQSGNEAHRPSSGRGLVISTGTRGEIVDDAER
jgi:hypothetical protein